MGGFNWVDPGGPGIPPVHHPLTRGAWALVDGEERRHWFQIDASRGVWVMACKPERWVEPPIREAEVGEPCPRCAAEEFKVNGPKRQRGR